MKREKQKIAILTNYPFDGNRFTGGVETATAGLLEGLRCFTEEFEFHVVALSKEIAEHRDEQRHGMWFHFLAVPGRWYTRPHLVPNVVHARSLLRRIKPDLIHCQDNMALAVATILSGHPRRVFTVHGIKAVESKVWEGPEFWSHKIDAMLEGWIRTRFTHVIAVSPYVHQFLPKRVRVYDIPNPVQSHFFRESDTRTGDHSLLFVGALTRLKRPFDVIRAFQHLKEELPDASLTIVGEPEDRKYESEMKHYVAANNLVGVHFLGPCSQEEVAEKMRTSSVLVLPSIQENSPMVLAESMACGLPVVAADVGGVSEMITHGRDGLLFEPGNITSLIETIKRLLREDGLWGALSRGGKAKAILRFSAESVAKEISDVYRNLIFTTAYE